jgi:RNA polymerase sigma-70 factor (ECF subfamily)
LNVLKKQKLKRIIYFGSDKNVENKGYENIIEGIEARERIKKMEKVMIKLPVKQREVFVMRNFDDLSYEEISTITGKSVGALKANYFHAFRKIKELMEKNDK